MTLFIKPIIIAGIMLPLAAGSVGQPNKAAAPKPVEPPAKQPEGASKPEGAPKSGSGQQPVQAQPATPPSSKPATPPKPPEPPTPEETIPNLDDLLGIPGQTRSGDSNVADPSKADLDRLLTGEEIGDAFKEAVTLMGDAAKRLKDGKDASLTTQRLQESIVRRLDQLLSSLDQQQQQQQSSSSQQQAQNQDKKQSLSVPNQQQGERKEENKNENDGMATTPPARRDGALRPGLEAVRSSWGQLPARVRDMLVQGSSDTFSSMYEKMTESYYKKLAEQGKAK